MSETISEARALSSAVISSTKPGPRFIVERPPLIDRNQLPERLEPCGYLARFRVFHRQILVVVVRKLKRIFRNLTVVFEPTVRW